MGFACCRHSDRAQEKRETAGSEAGFLISSDTDASAEEVTSDGSKHLEQENDQNPQSLTVAGDNEVLHLHINSRRAAHITGLMKDPTHRFVLASLIVSCVEGWNLVKGQ